MIKKRIQNKKPIEIVLILIGLIVSVAILVLIPAHFSYAAIAGIAFYAYSLFRRDSLSTKLNKILHIVVALCLAILFAGTLLAIEKNLGPGCAGLFGVRIECYGRDDMTFATLDAIFALIILGSLSTIYLRQFKNIGKGN